jgi:hypothetical protein
VRHFQVAAVDDRRNFPKNDVNAAFIERRYNRELALGSQCRRI